MDEDLKKIVEGMTKELSEWLGKPSPAAEKIATLRIQAGELKAELGAGVLGDLSKQLEQAEAEASRLRKRQAAEAIAEICRGLGIGLEAKDPSKRKRRKAKAPK